MQFENNIPWLQDGLDLGKIAFSGGRLTASIARHGGLMQIDYYGEQRFGDSSFFSGNAFRHGRSFSGPAWGSMTTSITWNSRRLSFFRSAIPATARSAE
jgi:hypothetical protein